MRETMVEACLGEETIAENGTEAIAPHPQPTLTNIFPCWLAMQGETPHRMTLYLKLNAPPNSPDDYHVQAEVYKNKWAVLKEMPLPWSIAIDPERLLLLRDSDG